MYKLNFIQDLTEDFSPGDSLSDTSEELLQRGGEEASIHEINPRQILKTEGKMHFLRNTSIYEYRLQLP